MIKKAIKTNLPTIIETPRLIIRAPQEGDGGGINAAKLDGYTDCVNWLNWPQQPATIEEDEAECSTLATTFTAGTDIRFMCIEKETGTILGRFAFPEVLNKWYIPMVGLSYFLRTSAQRKGYATEMSNALIRYAFGAMNINKFEIHCEVNNIKSQGIPQRLGLTLERVEKKAWPHVTTNTLEDVRIYSCFGVEGLPDLAVTW